MSNDFFAHPEKETLTNTRINKILNEIFIMLYFIIGSSIGVE